VLVAEGDAEYARRGEGASNGIADPARIEPAVAAYRRALALDPDSVPALSGLLRALFFRGGFCGEGGAVQKKTFGEAKERAEDAIRSLEKRAKRIGGAKLEALREVPGAAALYFWSGVSWGQWSLDHKMAAVWQGAAGKLRDYGEAAAALDPTYNQGSPYLLLGRLHADSPKVPLVTGFVSRAKGLAYLRRALEIAPDNTAAQFFLAEAILEHEPANRAEAVRLLTACAQAQPRAEYLVEDAHYVAQARAALEALPKEGPP
jgi:tetratricopeptide (TPR) repeat protein